MKKVISLILTLAMLLSMLTFGSTVTAAAVDNTVYTEVDTLAEFTTALANKENIKLMANIELAQNTTYKLYTGTTLNGNGYAITAPVMTASKNAFFSWDVGTTDPTIIKNVSFGMEGAPLTMTNVPSGKNVAVFTQIAAAYPTQWSNVEFYVDFDSSVGSTVSTVIPVVSGTHTFTDCTVHGEIDNYDWNTALWFGQINADGNVTMTNCKGYGHVTCVGSNAGGVVGQLKGTLRLTDCVNYANVATQKNDAQRSAAGFVAWGSEAGTTLTMTRCINYGTIAGYVQAGGMTGRLDNGTISLTDCVNYGNCKAQGGDAAGMIAQNMNAVTLSGCINYGRMSGYNAAGMIGGPYGNVTATNCLNVGQMNGEHTGKSAASGMVGHANGATITLTGCANIGEIYQRSGTGYGAGNFAGQLTDATLALTNCYAFGPTYSHLGNDGVFVGTLSGTATVTSSGCKYVASFKNDDTHLGSGASKINLNASINVIKSSYGIDTMIGDKGALVVATPVIRGVQSTDPQGGTQSIRLLATIGEAADVLREVGFRVTCTYNGASLEERKYPSTTVYTSINDTNGQTTKKISAESLCGSYIFALTIEDVPTENSTFTITATPYADGYVGKSVTVTFQNGVCTTRTGSTADTTLDPAVYGSPLYRVANSPLYRKSVLFTGDSIGYGTQDRGAYSPTRSWGGRISYIHDMNHVNCSSSGASLSNDRAANGGIIYELISKHQDKDFDFVVLHGGVNDAWGTSGVITPVGSVTPAGTTTFDLDTYAGGLEELITRVQTYYPNAKVGYIFNFYAPNCTSGTVSNMDAYFAVGKQICEKYGIPYLDLYHNEALRAELNVTTAGMANSTQYLPDNIHPNAGGYDVIYPYVEEWMINVLAAES